MANPIQPTGNNVPRMAGPRPPMAPQAGITPKEIVGILRRHVFMIVAFTILGTIAGGGSWFLLQRYCPKYRSVGSIEVLPPANVDPMTFGSTQTNKDIAFEFRGTKAFRIKQQGFLERLLRSDKIRETAWFNSFDKVSDRVEDLEDNLGASAQRDKSLILVSMTCGSAKEAARIAEEAITQFLAIERDDAVGDTQAKLKMRIQQRNIINGQLQTVEEDLKAQRLATQFGKLDKTTFRDYLDDRLEDVQSRQSELESAIENIKGSVNVLRIRKEREDFDDVVRERVERDPAATTMRLRVDGRKAELVRLKSQYGENHRLVKKTTDILAQEELTLNNWQEKIGKIVRSSELIQMMEKQQILEVELESRVRQVDAAMTEYKDLNRLRAEYEKDVTRRDEFQDQLEEINSNIESWKAILEDPTLSKVQLDFRPQPPLVMSSPRIIVFVPGGFMLGFMLAVGLAFAVELLNDLLRSPSDVMKHLRVPLLGTICHGDEDRSVKGVDLYHVVRQAPYSIVSECYRQFRANLKLSGSAEPGKTLLVTSGKSGDGKTSVAVNMTYTLVADDKRVLLIDTNFRKPSTATLFARTDVDGDASEHPDFGLSSYLMNQCDMADVVRSSGVEGFDIIDSGPLPLNPSELLGSERMTRLLKSMRDNYDRIIIDGPPLLVSEAKILASQADGTILVFNASLTRRGAAQRALRELKEIKANLVGTVLIGVRSMKGGYFNEVYRSYQTYQKAKPAATV